MRDQYVTDKLAILLKQIGFNLGTNCYLKITQDGNVSVTKGTVYIVATEAMNFNANANKVSKPLWQQVREFFNKQYQLDIQWLFDWVDSENKQWTCVTVGLDGMFYADTLVFGEHNDHNPNQVLEKGILAAIELVKSDEFNNKKKNNIPAGTRVKVVGIIVEVEAEWDEYVNEYMLERRRVKSVAYTPDGLTQYRMLHINKPVCGLRFDEVFYYCKPNVWSKEFEENINSCIVPHGKTIKPWLG